MKRTFLIIILTLFSSAAFSQVMTLSKSHVEKDPSPLVWSIRAGANLNYAKPLTEDWIGYGLDYGYNASVGFIYTTKVGFIWGVDLTAETMFDSKMMPALEVVPDLGWRFNFGLVKFDAHVGFGVGYDLHQMNLVYGPKAGLSLWIDRFILSVDYNYLLTNVHDTDFKFQDVNGRDVVTTLDFSPMMLEIKVGVVIGKTK